MGSEEVITMPIELTEQQQRALDTLGEAPAQVVDPRTNAVYVLIPASEYGTFREVLEDEQEQRAIRAVALRNSARRMDESP
jgi:hypothetical protein